MSSTKQIEANRRNGQRGHGGVTLAGKNNSRRNALKHGFYAREFLVSDEEKREFTTLREDTFKQWAPTTPLQREGAEQVAFCCWRCRIAPRVEARFLKALLKEQVVEERSEVAADENPAMTHWYGTNRETLRKGVKFLTDLERDVRSSGSLRDEWKEPLTKGFGIDFLEELTRWTSMKYDAILLAQHLQDHAETLNLPLPDDLKELRKQVVIDPQQGMEMRLKLIQQQTRHLQEISRILDQRSSLSASAQDSSPVDFAPRYFTTAMRDLHCAVQWLRHLRKNRL